MTVAAQPPEWERRAFVLPPALDRRFEAVVFDWDATAVSDPPLDGSGLRALAEELSERALHLAVVTASHVDNVYEQLRARPPGPGRLYLCAAGGSEVFEARGDELHAVFRREATREESAALDAAAAATIAELELRGMPAALAAKEPTRRTIELVPGPEQPDLPKARSEELLQAIDSRLRRAGINGRRHAVAIAAAAAGEAGLPDPRVTSDAGHVEIGLTDKSDSARWVLEELRRRGIGGRLVAFGGGGGSGARDRPSRCDPFLLEAEARGAAVFPLAADGAGASAGATALDAVLRDQLERRRRGDVPDPDHDPAWTLEVEGVDRRLERVRESLLTLSDGRLGTRGSPVGGDPAAVPEVALAGVYEGDGAATHLARAPLWTGLAGKRALRPRRRTLDLRTGVVREEGDVTSFRFSSLARPATVALRATGAPDLLPRGRRRHLGSAVRAAVLDRRSGGVLERLGAYDADDGAARAALAAAEAAGFETLLAEHRGAWAQRWEECDVVVEGDRELQKAIRFTLFHLIASVATAGEAAVGARGLSGSAYSGHVFWDTDVFVLPFFAATHPAAARAILEYRVRRLAVSREAARALGRGGARFAWESAADGTDVTPKSVRLPTGSLVRIRTGELEEHIVADVAWAASHYLEWTGDAAFAAGPARDLIAETARYWASRVRVGRDGRAHVYGVIGPDEYHEGVDDNAFTNVIARWNLRRAAALDGIAAEERSRWLEIADALVDGYDPVSGIYEQFAGFFGLEPLVIADIAPRRPVAADVLLGPERVHGAQVLKQADVLMLHHLVPDETAPDSLLPNLDFYEPRTAHGSSLSPAIHASLLARAGRYRAALDALRMAARIDLDDLTGTTAGGLHLATMGGLWQALAFGFAGVRPASHGVVVDPRLPPEWNALELGLRFHGEPLRLRVDRGGVSVDSERFVVSRTDTRWEVVPR